MDDFKYWMVHSPEGNPPSVQHHAEEDAIAEAKRLAGCNIGKKFYALEAKSAYVIEVPTTPTKLFLDYPPLRMEAEV
jgi:hypothetical protein